MEAFKLSLCTKSPSTRRAWIEIHLIVCWSLPKTSPSTRRAWIEIGLSRIGGRCLRSPSTRRAWIEIQLYGALGDDQSAVALHPEGVDRNRTSKGQSEKR